MTKINDGGAAFPDVHEGQTGMSLRDYFAGQALVGLYASVRGPVQTRPEDLAIDAGVAYSIADALLAAREAKP